LGKFAFDLDHDAYQAMLEEVESLGVPHTDLLPLIADVEGSGIYTLIGIVDVPTGNNMIPEIFCPACEETVGGILKDAPQSGGNFCACSECDAPIVACSVFRITERQLAASRMISEVRNKNSKEDSLRKQRRWWPW